MLFQPLRNILRVCTPRTVSIFPKQTMQPANQMTQGLISRAYHILSHTKPQQNFNFMNIALSTKLLTPTVSPQLIQTCGMKVKGRVHRRCRDCFLVVRKERLYNLCPTHPRHKQMAMKKHPKNTWILTHATQSKVRPW